MSKIIFFDKVTCWNCPDYAISFLESLQEKGHQIIVVYGHPDSVPLSLMDTNINYMYSKFDSYYVRSANDINKVLDYHKPDLYISNFATKGFERTILRLISSKGIPIIELDNIASEIMLYNEMYSKYVTKILPRYLIAFAKGEIYRKLNDTNIRLFQNNKDNARFLPFISDRICLKGKFFKDYLTENNRRKFPSEKLPVTGSLQLDYITKPKITKKNLFDKYNLNYSIPTIIVAPNPVKSFLGIERENFILKSISELKKVGYNIIINLHPSDRLSYPERFSKYEIDTIKTPDFYPFLKYSQCLITPPSTIGLEAAMAKTPIIVDTRYSQSLDFPYLDSDISIGIDSSIDKLLYNIENIINEKILFKFDNFVDRYICSSDGNSSLRIMEVVEEVINEHISNT